MDLPLIKDDITKILRPQKLTTTIDVQIFTLWKVERQDHF